jgi:hypothetical protein
VPDQLFRQQTVRPPVPLIGGLEEGSVGPQLTVLILAVKPRDI